MRTFLQYFILPVTAGFIGIFHFIYTTWSKLPEKTFPSAAHLPTTFSAGALTLIIIIMAWLTYKEKSKDSKKGIIELRLRSAFNLNSLTIESKDDNPISGMLSLRVDKSGKPTDLLQRQLCYDEFRNVGEPSFKDEKPTIFNNPTSFKKSRVRMLFQPAARTHWTRNLYDKDDLQENLYSSPKNSKGLQQVLIYTSTLESLVPEFLTKFPDPSNVYKVTRLGASANDAKKLPLLFDALTHIELLVKNQTLAKTHLDKSTLDNYLVHHWAIGAICGDGRGVEKFSLYYAVELAFDIDKKNNATLVSQSPPKEASAKLQEAIIEFARTKDTTTFQKAMDEHADSYPDGFNL